jgi:hypothetical protein
MIVWEDRGTLRTVTESADVTYDAAFRDLTYVYLEDSWILDANPTEYALRFVIEAVLTPEHAEYHPAKPGEQHCYRAGILMISSAQPILFEPGSTTEVVDDCGSEHANTLLSRENTTYQGSVSSAKKGIR